MTPWWHLGEMVGELPRLVLQALSFPGRRRPPSPPAPAESAPRAGDPGTPPPGPGEAPPSGAAPLPPRPGMVVLVGGTSLTDELVVELIRLAGGRQAQVTVIPGGHLEVPRSGERYARAFRRFGVSRVELLPLATRERAQNPAVVTALAAADLIFLGGGREPLLLDLWRGSPVQAALLAARDRGAVVAGMGAGAAVLGAAVAVTRDGEEVTWEEGLGLLPLALLQRERVQAGQAGSAFSSLPATGTLPAVAVDDATALAVEGGRYAYVLGQGAAIVAQPDGNGAPDRTRGGRATGTAPPDAEAPAGPASSGLAPRRLLVHVLPAGYTYDLVAGQRRARSDGGGLRAAR